MVDLSNIFGNNDDTNSSNDTGAAGTLVGDASSAVGLNVDSSQSNYNQDEDGSVSAQNNDNSVGLGADTDGLLGAVGDVASSTDQMTS